MKVPFGFFKSNGALPTVYTFGVYTDCTSEPISIYSISSALNIGVSVYTNISLTIPFNNGGFSESSFPSVVLPIGFSSNSSGLITSNTADIGGCG
jgi:hypothetical protein